jgi:hypothetical protein
MRELPIWPWKTQLFLLWPWKLQNSLYDPVYKFQYPIWHYRYFWTLTPLNGMWNDQNTHVIENALISILVPSVTPPLSMFYLDIKIHPHYINVVKICK